MESRFNAVLRQYGILKSSVKICLPLSVTDADLATAKVGIDHVVAAVLAIALQPYFLLRLLSPRVKRFTAAKPKISLRYILLNFIGEIESIDTAIASLQLKFCLTGILGVFIVWTHGVWYGAIFDAVLWQKMLSEYL